jgi:hypothetical protein
MVAAVSSWSRESPASARRAWLSTWPTGRPTAASASCGAAAGRVAVPPFWPWMQLLGALVKAVDEPALAADPHLDREHPTTHRHGLENQERATPLRGVAGAAEQNLRACRRRDAGSVRIRRRPRDARTDSLRWRAGGSGRGTRPPGRGAGRSAVTAHQTTQRSPSAPDRPRLLTNVLASLPWCSTDSRCSTPASAG